MKKKPKMMILENVSGFETSVTHGKLVDYLKGNNYSALVSGFAENVRTVISGLKTVIFGSKQPFSGQKSHFILFSEQNGPLSSHFPHFKPDPTIQRAVLLLRIHALPYPHRNPVPTTPVLPSSRSRT